MRADQVWSLTRRSVSGAAWTSVRVASLLLIACSARPVEPAAVTPLPDVAPTTPPPPSASTTATTAQSGWPCSPPYPEITERQEDLLRKMENSGRDDLINQAAEIRSKLCAGFAARREARRDAGLTP
jgi:hypothetical protein